MLATVNTPQHTSHSYTMPPPVRERYNAKARGSVAGGSSHKNRKRKSKHTEPEEEQLSQPHHEPGMSSKKRKRLDSYIASA